MPSVITRVGPGDPHGGKESLDSCKLSSELHVDSLVLKMKQAEKKKDAEH